MTPTVGDVLFVDTNVLLTATDASRPEHRDETMTVAEVFAAG